MIKLCLLLPLFPLLVSIYDYSVPAADGSTLALSAYQGKKLLIVNTAGGSDLAGQYAGLEALRLQYPDSLVIIAVPSNSFGHEQADDSTLLTHLQVQYDAGYLVTAKMEVTGDSIAPLYQWLTQQPLNGMMNRPVETDFQKFLIDKDGTLIGFFSSRVDPMSEELRDAIEGE